MLVRAIENYKEIKKDAIGYACPRNAETFKELFKQKKKALIHVFLCKEHLEPIPGGALGVYAMNNLDMFKRIKKTSLSDSESQCLKRLDTILKKL